MARLAKRRECLYCGSSLVLGECSIVATRAAPGSTLPSKNDAHARSAAIPQAETPNQPSSDGPGAEFDSFVRRPDEEYLPPSGAEVLQWTPSGWPVIAFGQLSERIERNGRRTLRDRTRRLPSPQESASLQDLPARACTTCGRPLPLDLDERPVHIVAVVGTGAAGKSLFLATALDQAIHSQSLAAYGYSQFLPDENTAKRYDTELYKPRVVDRKMDMPTEEVHFSILPLCFKLASEGIRDYKTIAIHDIPGEALMSRGLRADLLPFLRRADALVFLIDPKRLPGFRDRVHPDRPRDKEEQSFDQGSLVNSCLAELDKQRRRRVNVAVVLSKSDILPGLMGISLTCCEEAPAPDDIDVFEMDRHKVTQEVRSVLEQAQARDVLAAVDGFARNYGRPITFHAIAALGKDLMRDSHGKSTGHVDLVGRRCTEVLARVADGLMHNDGRRWTD